MKATSILACSIILALSACDELETDAKVSASVETQKAKICLANSGAREFYFTLSQAGKGKMTVNVAAKSKVCSSDYTDASFSVGISKGGEQHCQSTGQAGYLYTLTQITPEGCTWDRTPNA